MANEVDIEITAHDLSGPGFASALRNMLALKAAASSLRQELGAMGTPEIDANKMMGSLMMLKQKMQSLGIADIADININPGMLMVQLQLLKRLIQQAGISDILDINVNASSIQAALAKIGAITRAQTVPISFDVAPIPRTFIGQQSGPPTIVAGGMNEAMPNIASLNALNNISSQLDANLAALGAAAGGAAGSSGGGGGGLWGLAGAASGAWGWFGRLNQDIPLFAGALKGVPFLTAVGGIHLLADATLEFLAVIVPAGLALTAFGVGAAPVIADLGTDMTTVFNVSRALNQTIYPMSGQFVALATAVQPEVYQLFGDALVVINDKMGAFQTLAVATGKVVDGLGARIAVALTSGGLSSLIAQGPADLAKLGDIIGNIFGTIGNVLHVLPGYAQVLLQGLDDITKGMEAVTANPFAQWVIGAGLAVHGFIVWAGLGATAAVFLGNSLLSLAAKFGLVAAGTTVFDAAQFGAGLKAAAGGAGLLAGEMVTLGAGEDIAAAGALTLEGVWTAITAINPIVWIGAAIGALVALGMSLHDATSATQSYDTAVNQALQSAPVSQLGIDLAHEQTVTLGQLAQAQDQLNGMKQQGLVWDARTGSYIQGNTLAYKNQQSVIEGYKGELSTLQTYQANYNQLLNASGGNISILNSLGLTSNQITTASTEQMKQYIIQAQGQVDVLKSLSLGFGQMAAAQNAEGKGASILYNEQQQALTTLNQAEGAIINTVLGGEQAFLSFQDAITGASAKLSTPPGLANAAAVAGASIGGLNAQSQALANSFYSDSIPAMERLIQGLQQQSISQGNLTTVIATGAGQMLQYTGGNKAANSVIVDLINNALGPGTVSLQTLNKWVSTNSTTLQGFNGIVAASTIQAGTLAGVLQNDLNVQFHQALLTTSGASAELNTFTNMLVHGMDQTAAFHGVRQQLITDLENSGFSAKQATSYVNGLQNQIDALHGKTVGVGVNATGSGGFTITGTGWASGQGGIRLHAAQGGIVPMTAGIQGQDSVLVLAKPGEAMVPPEKVGMLAPALKAAGIPGFGLGGLVGSMNGLAPFAGGQEGSDSQKAVSSWIGATVAAMKSEINAQSVKASANSPLGFALLPGGGAPVGSSAGQAQAWARAQLASGVYGWGSGQFPPLLSLWNQESGWRWNALNPASGAYGIPQSLPADKMAAAGPDWLTNPVTQMRWGMAYIRATYGSPSGAEAHELAHNWYDNGGYLPPGLSLAYNGTGRPERVSPPGGQDIHVHLEVASSGNVGFDEFMINWMRKNVRTKGGGNVQAAFGRPGC